MAFKITLILNSTTLDLTNDQYSESYSSVDSRNTSEAGTTLRAVTRTGIRKMSISYECIEADKIALEALTKLSSVTATLYDETTSANVTWTCFVDGFKADLQIEDSSHRYYKVSFTLNDLES